MIKGHGDDIFSYPAIRHNFSSNIVCRRDLDALYEHLNSCLPSISSYPEPDASSLAALWAASMGISAHNLCVTNGATEAIYLIAQVYRESNSQIPVPTFSEYADACRLNHHRITEVYSESGLKPAPGSLVWICNPNNPTGKVWDHAWLTEMIEANPACIFIIDQSYAPYTLEKVVDVKWAVEMPNVLLLHSMTKQFGVPGLRIGGVSGNPRLIKQLSLFRMPWSVNALAIEAGKFLLLNSDSYLIDAEALIAERERVAVKFDGIGLIEVWPSDSNMLLSRLRMGKASALKDYLAVEKGILIRDASNFTGLDEGCFRIAVQEQEADNLLIEGIKEWMLSN
ncbi:MAG: aminotransferase class I/II-fold pyridoxal phosphate-dependent enzyme [Bacteroidaceae bacterium]|nr:aminotransferase class I/II-fold pyridoxal phosphate-dependent enzyme [Bacteroidaceae bacterium]